MTTTDSPTWILRADKGRRRSYYMALTTRGRQINARGAPALRRKLEPGEGYDQIVHVIIPRKRKQQ